MSPRAGSDVARLAERADSSPRSRERGSRPVVAVRLRTPAARHERCRSEPDRVQRSGLSTAVRAGYGQRRPPSRTSWGRDGSSRAIAASFFEGWTGLGRRAPGGGCPAGRAAGTPAALAARLSFRGALGCVVRDGRDGRAPRSPAVFPEGGRAGLSLVAVCGPRARSARGRRARHAPCRLAVGTVGWGGTARAGCRAFSLPACVRSPDNPRGLS